MITRVLVANRGEIARRVMHTCTQMGIETVAVFSDADTDAPHVREADAAVRLPGNAPSGTYLHGQRLVQAATTAGADAVHPGYGFLSENAAFAHEVEQAGLTWVGPPPRAIESMGSKITAKQLMTDAGVPVLPQLDPKTVTAAELPVLVKASAGGGGRGMRVAATLEELPGQVEAARAEAKSAFGDPTVFCEPYLLTGRHIEVQILADTHDTVWALSERECSIQRRHQKIIEETPSPLVDADMRARLCDAATAAARAIGYVGAGTVEFLATEDGRFFFLEMNTRLQVEHPVTECVTGCDLVRLQLLTTEGSPLPDQPPGTTGHAIEARLYAEDPTQDWRPQSGTLHHFAVPHLATQFTVPTTYGLRLDSGVTDGSAVGVHYDPMLAKVIAWAPTRVEAARQLAYALASARIHGLITNRDLLVRVLRHPGFLAGQTDTAFFDRHGLAALAEPLPDKETETLSALAAAIADAYANRASARVQAALPPGWRNVPSQPQRKSYETASGTLEVAYRLTRDGLVTDCHDEVALVDAAPERVALETAGVQYVFNVAAYPDLVCVDSPLGTVALRPQDRFPDPRAQVTAGSLLAPMPASVTAVHATEGEAVQPSQPLLMLEAMKMQHTIAAPEAGVVRSLHVEAGQQVDAGTVLAVVTPNEEGTQE